MFSFISSQKYNRTLLIKFLPEIGDFTYLHYMCIHIMYWIDFGICVPKRSTQANFASIRPSGSKNVWFLNKYIHYMHIYIQTYNRYHTYRHHIHTYILTYLLTYIHHIHTYIHTYILYVHPRQGRNFRSVFGIVANPES